MEDRKRKRKKEKEKEKKKGKREKGKGKREKKREKNLQATVVHLEDTQVAPVSNGRGELGDYRG